MSISLDLLKPKNFASIFVICHIISFFSLFIPYSSGAIVSVILIIVLIIHFKLFIRTLLEKENLLFCILLFFELISFLNYFLIPEARSFFFQNPSIVLQSFSYLFLPQVAFYFFGYYIGKFPDLKYRGFKLIVLVNLAFGVLSLIFHFTRPGFFTDFINRSIMTGEGYTGFYPRLTGYLNSMIVGILCSSCLILSFNYLKNNAIKILCVIVFSGCIVFSLQRGAWASMAIGLVFSFCIAFFYKPVSTILKSAKYAMVTTFLIMVTLFGLSYTKFNLLDNEMFETMNTDMVNKIASFADAAAERGYQKDSFFELINEYPLGVGFGLLSHKSADLGFQYAIPDGNYYRIGGEIGLLGLLIFVIIIIIALIKLNVKKEYALFIVLILYYLQAYGTNVFDLYMCGFLFWYILGISFSLKSHVSS